jgi:hypothetical protein
LRTDKATGANARHHSMEIGGRVDAAHAATVKAQHAVAFCHSSPISVYWRRDSTTRQAKRRAIPTPLRRITPFGRCCTPFLTAYDGIASASSIAASSFSGLFTRVEISHMVIGSGGNGTSRSRGSGSTLASQQS